MALFWIGQHVHRAIWRNESTSLRPDKLSIWSCGPGQQQTLGDFHWQYRAKGELFIPALLLGEVAEARKLTAICAKRWPAASIVGLDSSPEMIASARDAQPDRRWMWATLASGLYSR